MRWPECTAREFAGLVGVTPQTVNSWINAGMPCMRGRGRGSRVRISPKQAMRWAFARRRSKGSQHERLAKEQADKFAIENARRRGELVFTNQVSDVLSILTAELAARQDAVPGRVATEIAGMTDAAIIRQRLLDELREVRSAVADAVTQLADNFGAAEEE